MVIEVDLELALIGAFGVSMVLVRLQPLIAPLALLTAD